jgi:hypothetical protein
LLQAGKKKGKLKKKKKKKRYLTVTYITRHIVPHSAGILGLQARSGTRHQDGDEIDVSMLGSPNSTF